MIIDCCDSMEKSIDNGTIQVNWYHEVNGLEFKKFTHCPYCGKNVLSD